MLSQRVEACPPSESYGRFDERAEPRERSGPRRGCDVREPVVRQPVGPLVRAGVVADYISTLAAEFGRQPKVEEYSQIMTGYTPEQMPVLSAIARGFATFDHWFCEVPTCTYPNRWFSHAGASSGFVVNMKPTGSFPRENNVETLFERLEAAGLTWKCVL